MELRVHVNRFAFTVIFVFPLLTFSQVTIKGPSCVLAGTTYQYLISGVWDSANNAQVCLSGGTIARSARFCTANGEPASSIAVIWAQGTGANLQVNSARGSSSFSVMLTSSLTAGAIDTSTKLQLLASAAIPKMIICSMPTGGSCSANYQYQWQQSTSLLDWKDIPQATGVNLVLSQALIRSAYFRRKVTEINSGTIAYSDAAYVEVAPSPTLPIKP